MLSNQAAPLPVKIEPNLPTSKPSTRPQAIRALLMWLPSIILAFVVPIANANPSFGHGSLLSESITVKALAQQMEVSLGPQILSLQVSPPTQEASALYASASAGVIEFRWGQRRLLKVPDASAVFASAFDHRGRLFVAAAGEIGYFQTLESPAPQWVSLRDQLPVSDANRSVRALWRCGDAMYFDIPGAGLFRYQHHLQLIEASDGYRGLSTPDGCWMFGHEKGIRKVRNGVTTNLANESSDLALARLRITSLVRIDQQTAWLFAREGVYLASQMDQPHIRLRRLATASLVFANDPAPVRALVRHNAQQQATHVFAGGSGGIYVFDLQAAGGDQAQTDIDQPVRWIGPAEGLSGTIYGMAQYGDGVWISTGDALLRVEFPGQLERFDQAHGLRGTPTSLAITPGLTIVGSTEGLFALRQSSDRSPAKFQALLERSEFVPACAVHERQLYFATRNSLQRLALAAQRTASARTPEKLIENISVLSMMPPSPELPLFVLGQVGGASVYQESGSAWHEVARFDLDADVRSITLSKSGELWLGSEASGAIRIRFSYEKTQWRTVEVRRFTSADGLPRGITVPFVIDHQLRITSPRGIFTLQKNTDRLVLIDDDIEPYFLALADSDNWLVAGDGARALSTKQPWQLVPHPINRLPKGASVAALQGDDRSIWALTSEGLFRHDRNEQSQLPPTPRAALALDWELAGQRRAALASAAPTSPEISEQPVSLRANFFARDAAIQSQVEFRAQLIGAEAKLSSFSRNTERRYTRLSEGKYQLRVQARDAFQRLSPWVHLDFEVPAPWWRRPMALPAWVMLAIGVVALLWHWRGVVEAKKRLQLEQLVAEKTSALQALAANRQRLLHDLSHELRSPLARLRLHLELLRLAGRHANPTEAPRAVAGNHTTSTSEPDSALATPSPESRLQQADHEIGRMDLLVNELLTLSRIEHQPELAGKQTVILHDVIADCVSSARVEAEVAGKQLTLALHAQAQLQGHEELLARAMDNLIRNAIRHTAAQTAVHVHFLVVDEAVELHVEDAGPGVPDALREKIFDAFFRIPATDQGTERGYGLGLALARRVAYLHGANLSAHNRLEGGLRMVMRFDGITASSISQITPLEVVAARS